MQNERSSAEVRLHLSLSPDGGIRLESRPVSLLKLADMCRCGDCPLPVWNCPFGAKYCGDVNPGDWEALLEGRLAEAHPASLEDAAGLADAGGTGAQASCVRQNPDASHGSARLSC